MARSHQLIGRRRERLAGLAQRLERRSPRAQLGRRREQLVNMQLRLSASLVRGRERQREKCVRLGERLARAEPQRLERLRQRLLLAQAKLNGRNPEAILELGYAIVRHEGRALKDVHGVALGVVVEARLGPRDARRTCRIGRTRWKRNAPINLRRASRGSKKSLRSSNRVRLISTSSVALFREGKELTTRCEGLLLAAEATIARITEADRSVA